MAIENAKLYINPDSPPIQAASLEALAKEYMSSVAILKRLAQSHDEEVLTTMLKIPLTVSDVNSDTVISFHQDDIEQWVEQLLIALNKEQTPGRRYAAEIEWSDEIKRVVIQKFVHGLGTDDIFSQDFFESSEFRLLQNVARNTNGLIEKGAYIERGERRAEVEQFSDVMHWLLEEAKRGQSIQRYKGLGEMNPDQLWETTMNPESRLMVQVNIEDAVAADQIFSTLMGDQVEPRREFIESNALSATNIDV